MNRIFNLLLLVFFIPLILQSQSIQTEFGKNRVQYHDDFKKWWSYETENFITYWYGKGRNVAHTVVQMAELDYNEIQNIMEHRINDKVEIIVFLDVSDMKQSNIGSEDTFVNITDQTKTVGNKMFVYFDGNHKNLRRQIREGIADVFLNSMFSNGSLQEMVQSAIKLNVPPWYERGIISYAGVAWDELIDDELRDIWYREEGKFKDFEKISDEYPKIAGHSFWYFIDQMYGKSTIANLLYLTRINRDLDESFLFVLGIKFDSVVEEWKSFYESKYSKEEGVFDVSNLELDLKNKDHAPVSLLKFSPDGNFLAYAHNHLGAMEVRIKDMASGEEKRFFKYGYKNNSQETDFNYPLLAWNNDGTEITIVYEHRDKIRLRKVLIATEEVMEQTIPENFHRIFSIDYINEQEYILSASTDGYSDLYIYKPKSRGDKRLTEDFYDDLDVSYVEIDGTGGVLFTSNRTNLKATTEKIDTILPLGNYNVYFFPYENGTDDIEQLTFSKSYDNRYPQLIASDQISYLNLSNGINNIHHKKISASAAPKIVTNLDRNIIRYHKDPSSDLYSYTLYDDEAYRTYLDTIDASNNPKVHITDFSKRKSAANAETTVGIFPLQTEEETQEEMQDGFLFQSEFDDPPKIESLDLESTNQSSSESSSFGAVANLEQLDVIKFNSQRAIAARTKFKLEDITTKLDNQVLFEGLESFAGDDKELTNAPMGFLIKAVTKDLFEDYKMTAGIRIPTRFNGAEQFAILDNDKALIDHRFALYRKAESNRVDELSFPSQTQKRTSMLGQYRAKYPFDVYRSISAMATLRFDKLFLLASDAVSANTPADNEKRLGLKIEYIYDNTINIDLNVNHGTRYKVYTEFLNRFNLQFTEGFEFDVSKGFTGVIGFDARHYIPVLGHGVLALRGAGAASFGGDKILYYLGGSDGSVISKFNQNIPIPQDRNFSYKVIAPHLRGFDYNIRNGSSFALANAELRIPIFQYFMRRTNRSTFLRNFQIVGFADVGTAWHGLTPSSDDNPINSVTINQPPVLQIKVQYYKDPLVMGYGAGLRASVLGYFLRLDYARGVESRVIQSPKIYLSVGTDF